ncbi:hypothetical protein N9Q68_01475, partial [Polaribacter sp.]|nr:hypothetical protein [Polaribacter sp.]
MNLTNKRFQNVIMGKLFFSTRVKIALIISCIALVSCSKDEGSPIPSIAPLFTNSIVSTDIGFIKTSDPDAFISLVYIGKEDKEMPDSRTEELFDTNSYVFEASFSNGTIVEIWAHSSFGNQSAAQVYADKLSGRLGKLPEFMRDVLSHAVVHNGDAGAFSDAEGHFMVLYSDNMDTRIINNDLEETVFHEAVHATLDEIHVSSSAWTNA